MENLKINFNNLKLGTIIKFSNKQTRTITKTTDKSVFYTDSCNGCSSRSGFKFINSIIIQYNCLIEHK